MGNERMERKITIEEHVLYKEDYQMKMLKANSLEGFLKVAGRGMNGNSYYDYDVSGKVSMQAMYTAIYVPVWECAERNRKISAGYPLYSTGTGIYIL